MRYFRHAPLTFWVTIVLMLTITISAAWFAGRDTGTNITVRYPAYDTRKDALSMLERVSGVYPAITTLDLYTWAKETSILAEAGLANYLASGGLVDDKTGLAWTSVAVEARNLATEGVNDTSAAIVGAARLGSATQILVANVDGLAISTISNPQTEGLVSEIKENVSLPENNKPLNIISTNQQSISKKQGAIS